MAAAPVWGRSGERDKARQIGKWASEKLPGKQNTNSSCMVFTEKLVKMLLLNQDICGLGPMI